MLFVGGLEKRLLLLLVELENKFEEFEKELSVFVEPEKRLLLLLFVEFEEFENKLEEEFENKLIEIKGDN